MIVQHADQDVLFQQSALKAMQQLNGTTESSMEHYAFLYDRVQCNLNYKQLYGTQVVWTSNGEASAFRPMLAAYAVTKRTMKLGLQPLSVYALNYGFNCREVTRTQSELSDLAYRTYVRGLMDSAKHFYRTGAFPKAYDYYNTASSYIGGMSNADNWAAALIFSKIAAVDGDVKYRSIALDFLDLLYLRGALTKLTLSRQPAFKVLRAEKRWIALNNKVRRMHLSQNVKIKRK